jgi:hypothetical protein
MAREMVERGRDPAFYWGQAYGGTLEVGLVAVVFAVTGTSVAGLKAVPLMLLIAAAMLQWRVARRVLGDGPAPVAGALLLVYPPAFIWWSTKERGFYWVSLVCVLAGVLLLLRVWSQRPEPSRLEVAALGFVVGVGWWTSPQTLFVLAPALVWLLVQLRHELRRLLVAVPAALVGMVPWIAWNLDHDFRSLQQPAAGAASTYFDRLDLFFSRLLPTVLGLRRPFSGAWLFGPVVGITLYVGAAAAFLAIAWLAWQRRDQPLLLFVWIALAYPLLFAIPATSYFVGEPRYGLMLGPVIVLFIARAATRPAWRLAVVGVAAVLAVSTVASTMDVADANTRSADLVPPRFAALERELQAEGVDRVYADYWLAYALTFASRERILASPVDSVRNPELLRLVAAAPRATYVTFEGGARDETLRRELEARDVRHRRVVVGDFAVYYIDSQLDPSAVLSDATTSSRGP